MADQRAASPEFRLFLGCSSQAFYAGLHKRDCPKQRGAADVKTQVAGHEAAAQRGGAVLV
jgi:hypothetical protein